MEEHARGAEVVAEIASRRTSRSLPVDREVDGTAAWPSVISMDSRPPLPPEDVVGAC